MSIVIRTGVPRDSDVNSFINNRSDSAAERAAAQVSQKSHSRLQKISRPRNFFILAYLRAAVAASRWEKDLGFASVAKILFRVA